MGKTAEGRWWTEVESYDAPWGRFVGADWSYWSNEAEAEAEWHKLVEGLSDD